MIAFSCEWILQPENLFQGSMLRDLLVAARIRKSIDILHEGLGSRTLESTAVSAQTASPITTEPKEATAHCAMLAKIDLYNTSYISRIQFHSCCGKLRVAHAGQELLHESLLAALLKRYQGVDVLQGLVPCAKNIGDLLLLAEGWNR